MRLLDIEKLHGNIMKTSYDLEMINMEAREDIKALVNTSENLYKKQIKDACKFIIKQDAKTIYISGPSAAGKTTTAKLLRDELKKQYNIVAKTVSLDDFFVNMDETPKLPDGSPDLENFKKIDRVCFNKFFEDIMTSGKAKMPEFDFKTGCRKAELLDFELAWNEVLIIEGTHALNPKLIETHKFDDKVYKIYICVNSNFDVGDKIVIPAKSLRMMRRLVRDYFKRNETVEKFLKLWPHVLEGEDEFIKPYKTQADFLIDTVHMYEPLLYAYYLKDILHNYLDVTKHPNKMIEDFAYMISCSESFDKSIVPKNSLMWEFLDR